MGVVGNSNYRGLTLMKGMLKKQYGQRAAGHGQVKVVLPLVLRAQTQPQQRNLHTQLRNTHVVSFCMCQDPISIQCNF